MRRLLLLLLLVLVYVEISLFIKVAEVLGVALTLLLVIVTSAIGASMVRSAGIKTLIQIQQRLARGESPAAEMVKSVSLVLAGLLLVVPGFFTDFLGLLLLLPPIQKRLTLKLLPHLSMHSSSTYHHPTSGGQTFDGEYQRKDDDASRLGQRDDTFKNDK